MQGANANEELGLVYNGQPGDVQLDGAGHQAFAQVKDQNSDGAQTTVLEQSGTSGGRFGKAVDVPQPLISQ